MSYSMAARNAPSTLPIGLVKSSVASNATSIVPFSTSALMKTPNRAWPPPVGLARALDPHPKNGPDSFAAPRSSVQT